MASKRGELALVAGGVIIILGSMLSFAEAGGESINVWDAEEGSPYLIAAITAILAGALLWFVAGSMGRKVIAVLAILIVGFFGAYAGFVDSSDMGDLGLDVGIGLWIMIAGSVIALVGAVLTLTGGKSSSPAAPAV